MALKRKVDPVDRDAHMYIVNTLKSYGLGDLGSVVWTMLKRGYSEDRAMIEVQETKMWKNRFRGNEWRRNKGLPVLEPAEYLALESSYRQVMQQAGLPPGFYDHKADFDQWIGNDVSPTEIQGRVTAAQQLVESADAGWREQFERLYGKGNLVAYALDRKRTVQTLQRNVVAAQMSSAAEETGFGELKSRANAERLAEQGLTASQARAGFSEAERRQDALGRLAGLSGEDYSREDAFDEVFFQDEDVADRARGLASQERARFSGSSGLSESSLASGDARGF